jgi:hypothetical protein
MGGSTARSSPSRRGPVRRPAGDGDEIRLVQSMLAMRFQGDLSRKDRGNSLKRATRCRCGYSPLAAPASDTPTTLPSAKPAANPPCAGANDATPAGQADRQTSRNHSRDANRTTMSLPSPAAPSQPFDHSAAATNDDRAAGCAQSGELRRSNMRGRGAPVTSSSPPCSSELGTSKSVLVGTPVDARSLALMVCRKTPAAVAQTM